LDGGGYLGLATAAYLRVTEEYFGTPCSERFDLFCGTSTGGIIALALATGMTAAEVEALYRNLGSTVFGSGSLSARLARSLRSLLMAKYSSGPLRAALAAAFGEKSLGDIHARGKCVVIPSYCLTTGSPRLFKTDHHADLRHHNEYRVVDVALATSAAPTYFPVVAMRAPKTKALERFADGGLFANNPALIAYTEAIRYLGVCAEDVQILSISTPRAAVVERAGKASAWSLSRGIPGWATKLPDLFIGSGMDLSHHALNCLIDDGERYHRVALPTRPGLALDRADEAATETLIQIGVAEASNEPARRRLAPFFSAGEEVPNHGERAEAV